MCRAIQVLCLFALTACALLLPSCAWDGHLDVLGYTTKPNYDTCFKTIRVPIFKSRVPLAATPVPGLEMDLTEALVREIQTKTPYKISQGDADTELTGVIVSYQKTLLNYTQFNTVREAETTLAVELIWRDLRTGKILTKTSSRAGQFAPNDPRQALLPDDLVAGATTTTRDSVLPPGSKPIPVPAAPRLPSSDLSAEGSNEFTIIDPITREKAVPIRLQSVAHFRPELGESITTALQKNVDRMAVLIVSVMEKGW